jgi:hypothetical protein
MSSQDRNRHSHVLTQARILKPDSQVRGATRDEHDGRHANEQDRRAKSGNVRHGPLKEDSACARGFVLAGLKHAKCRRGEQHGGRQHRQPLADGNGWQSERF